MSIDTAIALAWAVCATAGCAWCVRRLVGKEHPVILRQSRDREEREKSVDAQMSYAVSMPVGDDQQPVGLLNYNLPDDMITDARAKFDKLMGG